MFQAHRLLYHSTLGLRVIKKKNEERTSSSKRASSTTAGFSFGSASTLGFRV